MRLKRYILLFSFLFCAHWSPAQLQGEYIRSRILILLDGSSSMTEKWGSGKAKYNAAQELIMKLIDSVYAVNSQVQFGLRVFGHQSVVSEKNCYDTRNEVPFSTDNRSQMMLRLQDIHPQGITPIAFAMMEAAEKDITDEEHNVYSIILITDGGESCGGDICEVMKKLIKNKVYIKPYIVSLENDPKLKATYDCMGEFLQVTNDNEIPPAVSKIVEAFRPVFKISKTEYNELQTIAQKAPSVLKVNTVKETQKKWVPSVDNIATLNMAGLRLIHTTIPSISLRTASAPAVVPPVKVEQPTPDAVKITRLVPGKLRELKVPVAVFKPIPFTGQIKPPPVVADEPAPKGEKIAKLRLAPVTRLYWAMVMETHALSPRAVPPLPPVKLDPTFKVPTPEPASHEVKVDRVDNSETTLEVYFTNGKGKFYTTAPQLVLIDPSTKGIVKKFYRTVDPDGNPDPQTNIAPGNYYISVATNPDFKELIKIEHNKKNKYTYVVKNASLSFIYENAGARKITEFHATVIERNKAHGRVQDQPCNEKIEYEPGNYHVEIKTFPVDYRNVELEFDIEKVITIPQPGFAKFVSDGRIKSVNLYQHIGDKFLQFYTLNLALPIAQHLQIQPGEYQVHYSGGPGPGSASEKVKIFRVRPNEETTIDLN